MEWSVGVEAAHPGGQSVDQDAAEDLVELLGPYHVGGVAFSRGHYGCRFDVHAESPSEATVEAERIFAKAAAVAGLPPWPVVHLEVAAVEDLGGWASW